METHQSIQVLLLQRCGTLSWMSISLNLKLDVGYHFNCLPELVNGNGDV